MKRGTPDHPKMVMLTMELEKIYAKHKRKSQFGGRAEAIGILEILWDWASKFAIRGDVGKWPNAVISEAIGWRWNPDELIYALIESKWLDVAAEPARLVIHDIQDHATNAWRQNLENAGLTWWDGSSPRKYKLQTNSKNLQKNSNVPPQAKPKPKPEAKAEPCGESFVGLQTAPPPLTTEDAAPGTLAVREMLVEFTRGRFGQPDDKLCMQLLNLVEGDAKRIESWLMRKALKSRDAAESWGWFLQVGRDELCGVVDIKALAARRSMPR